jgi:hypothetical protein
MRAKPNPLRPATGMLVQNAFNNEAFEKRFATITLRINMFEGDKYRHERLSNSVSDFEGLNKCKAYAVAKHDRLEYCYELLVDAGLQVQSQTQVNPYCSIHSNKHTTDNLKIKLLSQSLNALKSNSLHAMSGSTFDCTTKENLRIIQYFSIEHGEIDGSVYLYPRLFRFTRLTKKKLEADYKYRRYSLAGEKGNYYMIPCDKGDYAANIKDNKKSTMTAISTDKSTPFTRANLFDKAICQLNEMVGDIYRFELQFLEYTEERKHKASEADLEAETIEEELFDSCFKIQLWFCKGSTQQKEITKKLRAYLGSRLQIITSMDELKEHPTIAVTLEADEYKDSDYVDPKTELYKRLSCVQVVNCNSKISKAFIIKIINELFWKQVITGRIKWWSTMLEFMPDAQDDMLFIEAKRKDGSFYFNVMRLNKKGITFDIKANMINRLPNIGRVMSKDCIDAIRDEEARSTPFMVVVNLTTRGSEWVIIKPSNVIVTPKSIYATQVKHEKNRNDIVFTLQQVESCLSQCDASKKLYLGNKMIVERLRIKVAERPSLKINYHALVDGSGNAINHKSELFKRLYGKACYEMHISKHHLDKTFSMSYYNERDGYYSCGYYDAFKATGDIRFPNIKYMGGNSKRLERMVFDMTACYTIRADKGATVRPAPFKMLNEIVERDSVTEE